MNTASVESIKSNFDLANFTENELQEKIDSLSPDVENSLINLLTKLDGGLTIYKAIGKDIEAQQIQFSNIIDLLEKLNSAPSLKLFNYLFGYYENKIFLPKKSYAHTQEDLFILKDKLCMLTPLDLFIQKKTKR